MKSKRSNGDGKSPFEQKIREILDDPKMEEDMRVTQALLFIDAIPDPTIEKEMRGIFRNELNRKCWDVLHKKQKGDRL
jgi:hypothetical protein